MKNFPELLTERLRLRRMQVGDIPSLIKYANNKKISDQIINIPFPYNEEDAIYRFNFILQGFKHDERFVFAITIKDENELIGEIGLHRDEGTNNAQFGYWIAEPFWGKGIATEATAALLKFGFEQLNLDKIYATHYTENTVSGRVMLKNRMIREDEINERYKSSCDDRNVLQYRLTRAEYYSGL